MPITDLLQTNTFRDWFNKTNEIILALNTGVVAAGVVANGTYTVNGSFKVVNTFIANTTVVHLYGNTTLAANTTATANCNVWNFACGSLLIQPINGTTVNTAMTFTTAAPVTFNGTVTATANLAITADVTQTGNTLINGALTSNSGPFTARQVLFASTGAMLANALAVPQVDDYGPAGLNEASVINITPSIDCAITGIAAPTNFTVGARILYLQNLSATYKLTLPSANTSSGAFNRFKFPNDTPVIILPGGVVGIIYTSVNKEWRALSPETTSLASLTVTGQTNLLGNTVIGGWINVANDLVVAGLSTQTGNASFGGFINVASSLQVAGLSTLTGNTTVTGWINTANKLVVAGNGAIGGNLSVTGLSTLTGNTSIAGFANVTGSLQVGGLSTQTGNATFGGFVNVASSLQVTGLSTLTGNATFSGFANVTLTLQVAGVTTLSANAILNGTRCFANGQLRCDTTNGRLVLPVGTNLWAT